MAEWGPRLAELEHRVAEGVESGVKSGEWSGVEWSGVEWSGVEWSGEGSGVESGVESGEWAWLLGAQWAVIG